ncbi:MAG: aminopeptidase P family protein [Proteobacteria bacterium]|nr:aminopeptidase P family protein [Burkholderiales bacterium]
MSVTLVKSPMTADAERAASARKTRADAMGNLALLERAIDESPYDAVIAVSPENVRYAADVHIATQRSIRDRLAFVVWPKGGEPVLLVCVIEAAYAKKHSWMHDVRGYQEFEPGPVKALAELLREMKLDAARVALETDYLAAAYYNDLVAQCPQLKIGAAEPVFARARMQKTPAEVTQLVAAFHATEEAFLHAFTSVKIGDTEKQIAVRLAERMLTEGADQVTSNYCNAGANTGFPHMVPSAYRVQTGDLVKSDSGGMFRQYFSNVGRTAIAGRASAKDVSVWKHLRDIHHAVIEQCRAGRTGAELFQLAKQRQEQAGLAFPYSHNGHSLGLNIHEHPIINAHEHLPYQAGMITTVETRARWPGELGYHMEDLIEITDGAPIWHARCFRNEELLVVG